MPSRLLLAIGAAVAAGCNGDDTTDGGTELAAVDVAQAGPQVCDEVSVRAQDGPFLRNSAIVPPPSDVWTWAGGLSVVDLDNDGWPDVVSAVEQGLELYEGNAAFEWTSAGQTVFAGFDVTFASGVSAADYDGDGDIDLYVMRVRGPPVPADEPTHGANRLLQNNGGGRFVDVTDEAGGVDACGPHHRTGEDRCYRTMSSSWGDYDGDGDLDLFVGNYGFVDEADGVTQDMMEPAEPSFLYRNNGNGTFTNVSDLLPDELHDGYTYSGGFVDLDNDGDLDLYTVNDFGNKWPNRVLWNEGGQLVFDTFDDSGLVVNMTGMGLGVADLNGDGWLDLAIPQWNDNWLLESRADLGIWVDVADSKGFTLDPARNQVVGWGTEAGDIDNDGDVDLVSNYGRLVSGNSIWDNPERQQDSIYLNEPDGQGGYTLRDVAAEWVANDPWMTRGVVLADIDRDGWLDITKRNLAGENILYLSHCGEDHWLRLHLRQPDTMNQLAIGARVTVLVESGPKSRHLLAGGTGYASSPPPELHFGLGQANHIDQIEVLWPDGKRSIVNDIAADQDVTITRK